MRIIRGTRVTPSKRLAGLFIVDLFLSDPVNWETMQAWSARPEFPESLALSLIQEPVYAGHAECSKVRPARPCQKPQEQRAEFAWLGVFAAEEAERRLS